MRLDWQRYTLPDFSDEVLSVTVEVRSSDIVALNMDKVTRVMLENCDHNVSNAVDILRLLTNLFRCHQEKCGETTTE